MVIALHEKQYPSEFLEINPFFRLQLVFFEEGNNSFPQVIPISHPIGHSVAVVRANHAASEEAFQGVQDSHITLVLYHREFRQNLVLHFHVGMSADADVKTTLTIDKAYDPLCIQFHNRPRTLSL